MSILKTASKHPDQTKPIEIPATIRVFTAGAGVVDHGDEVCVGQLLDSGTFVGVCRHRPIEM